MTVDPTRPTPRTRGAFTLTVYDKNLTRLGWVGSYVSFKPSPRHNAAGSADLVLWSDHKQVVNLTTPGARLVVEYDDRFLMSGYVRRRAETGPNVSAVAEFHLVDDFQLMYEVLGWPRPAAGINEQGAETAYHRVSGPAETVVKTFVKANAVDRLQVPHVRVATDRGRGNNITVKMRMHPLGERLFPVVDFAGIGVTVQQQGDDIVVDCYETITHDGELAEEAGTVAKWGYSWEDPTASHLVIGGGGEGTDREFRLAEDTGRANLWGWVREAFVDARDIGTDYEAAIKDVPEKLTDLREANNDEDKAAKELKRATKRYDDASANLEDAQDASNAPGITRWTALKKAYALADKNEATTDHNATVTEQTKAQAAYDAAVELRNRLRVEFNQDMADRGEQKLTEAASAYGLDIGLAETDTFRFGAPLELGDAWPVAIRGRVVSVEKVTGADLSDTPDTGLQVTPLLGGGTSKPLKNLLRIVGDVVRKVSDRDAGR